MKEGDIFLNKLRQAAKRRNSMALFVFALKYDPPWWYWLDWQKVNFN